jgi:hypothetical protein
LKKIFFEIKGLIIEVDYKLNSTFESNYIRLLIELKCNIQLTQFILELDKIDKYQILSEKGAPLNLK